MFASIFFPLLTVILAVACYACYRTNKPLRDKAKAEAQAEIDKAKAEAKRIARSVYEADIAEGVTKALKLLFDESRTYDVRVEEERRQRNRMGYSDKAPLFNRETREVFHKVLRVGALEERVGYIEEGNKVRLQKHREMSQQVEAIHQAMQPYA